MMMSISGLNMIASAKIGRFKRHFTFYQPYRIFFKFNWL